VPAEVTPLGMLFDPDEVDRFALTRGPWGRFDRPPPASVSTPAEGAGSP